jgi:predicted outer membrane repeat protein
LAHLAILVFSRPGFGTQGSRAQLTLQEVMGMLKSAGVKGLVWGPAAMILLLCSAVRPLCGQVVHANTVTNTSDSGPGSLRAAIASAQNGYIINFNITFPAIILLKSPLTLRLSVTIAGPGASKLAISGGDGVGVFIVNAGATVAISGLAIEHGSSLLGGGILNGGTLTLTNVTVANDTQGTQLGGGIFNSGTLTLSNSTVSANSAGSGSGIGTPPSGSTGLGGGIYNYGKTGGGLLTLTNSTVSANSAKQGEAGSAGGGGIYNDEGHVTLTNSVVTNNTLVAGCGGGIYNNSGTLSLTTTTVSGNSVSGVQASGGAGICINSGAVTVTESTISGNTATNVLNGTSGGGILANSGTLSVINSTFAGNSADDGGAISSTQSLPIGGPIITNSTFWGNQSPGEGGGAIFASSGLTMKNSILANNTPSNCAFVTLALPPPYFVSDGHNLSDDASCSALFTGPGDSNKIPAGLDPGGLNTNGGPTQTVALLATSPAVNAIPVSPTNYCTDVNGNPVTTDQRGVPRPQGSGCDIGAYELESVPAQVSATEINGTFQGNIAISSGTNELFETAAKHAVATRSLPKILISATTVSP